MLIGNTKKNFILCAQFCLLDEDWLEQSQDFFLFLYFFLLICNYVLKIIGEVYSYNISVL